MPVKNPLLLYLRSRLNFVLSLGAAFLVVLSLLFLRPFALLPISVIILAYAALTGALFFSRRGAREVVAESEEDRRKEITRKIECVRGNQGADRGAQGRGRADGQGNRVLPPGVGLLSGEVP